MAIKTQQRAEHDQEHADAIDPEVKLNADGVDPVAPEDKTHTRGLVDMGRVVELCDERERDKKAHQGHQVGDPLHGRVSSPPWPQNDECHSHQREEADNGQNVLHVEIHGLDSQVKVEADHQNDANHKGQGILLKHAGLKSTDYPASVLEDLRRQG